MDWLGPATRRWFDTALGSPTAVQARGWPVIARGAHTLLLAPTGSGKTLAAFLFAIDRLTRSGPSPTPGVRVLYVSPLKALVVDVDRNLRAPLGGIAKASVALGLRLHTPRLAVRTGDTPPRARRAQQREPAEILATTPESLYVLLGSAAREQLRSVETVIVDEVHALAPNKRGAHLALSLERLSRLCPREPQRIGLSATAAPASEIARFLGGDRPVEIVDVTEKPALDVRITIAGGSLRQPVDPSGPPRSPDERGIWPAIHRAILGLVGSHQSTIVFVNSRAQSERLCRRLCELAGEPIARAHHGSLAHEQRAVVEQELKDGRLRAIVATSSLELGIDMGAVDHVVLVESPGSVARGLQRAGRAGHRVGARSQATVLPKTAQDLLECVVLTERMRRGAIEPTRIPRCPLDVLAQQVVAASAVDEWALDDLFALVRRAAPYSTLGREAFESVLAMLAGRYPSTELADMPVRIVWDRVQGSLRGRASSRAVALASGGTIVDRGLYRVETASGGSRVGELDEEMVHETRRGDVVTLGASSWQVEQIRADRVVVRPAPGRLGRLPFWHGDRPGRSASVGRAIGAFVRELWARPDRAAWLARTQGLARDAAEELCAWLAEQHGATGSLPTDRAVTIERFRDEVGDWRICILSPWGARVHATWALAIGATLAARSGYEARALARDDGISLHFAAGSTPDASLLVPAAAELEQLVLAELPGSGLFAGHFRENAARALLLARRGPGARTPLWAQRHRAARLLGVARTHPDFPIVLETFRSCLEEALDLPTLRELLAAIASGAIVVHEAETRAGSPLARSLAFAEVAAYMYESDQPAAERRAHRAIIDVEALRQLVGDTTATFSPLEPAAVESVLAQAQRTAPDRRARSADELHDVLRTLGDLTEAELLERTRERPDRWLGELVATGRAARWDVAVEGPSDEEQRSPHDADADAAEDGPRPNARWIAADDLPLFRAAASESPDGDAARIELLSRFARNRGPFGRDELGRFGWTAAQQSRAIEALVRAERLAAGTFLGGSAGTQWCEPTMLRRLRREEQRLARLAAAPVDAPALARFLARWHGIGGAHGAALGARRGAPARPTMGASSDANDGESRQGGPEAQLELTLDRIEGLALPFDVLERWILPARIGRFAPRLLDDAAERGLLTWMGDPRLGPGAISLLRRKNAALLAPELATGEEARAGEGEGALAVEKEIVALLSARGASFFAELLGHLETASVEQMRAALWTLVWSGRVTNDGFEALRRRARGGGHAGGAPRYATSRASRTVPEARGRWALTAAFSAPPAAPTARAYARACMLLARYGVVAREMALHEECPGGFEPIYAVLAAMAERGQLQRGTFVAGLGAAQFALPGVVDELRAPRPSHAASTPYALSTLDPALPFGVLAPWPALRSSNAPAPRASAGTSAVLVDGEPVLLFEGNKHRLWSFAPATQERIARALSALPEAARAAPQRTIRIEAVDGETVRRPPWHRALRDAGFEEDPRGLVLEARQG